MSNDSSGPADFESHALAATQATHEARIRSLVDNHQAFLRRTLRRLGLDEGRSEDAVQQVFVVASRRLDRVRDGKERAYLFGIATRVASDIRRGAAYRHELPCADIVCEDASLLPDAAADRRRAFEILAMAVDVMPPT